MQQHTRALDMAEEAVAQPDAVMRAFDKARNVGEDEFRPVDGRNAEVRMQRGEGVVGDLRPGARAGGEEGRLAGIGQADEAGIGNELQPQPDRLSSPSRPGLAQFGAWLVEVLKWALPKPPLPPAASLKRCPP